jgi:hypothetical protein
MHQLKKGDFTSCFTAAQMGDLVKLAIEKSIPVRQVNYESNQILFFNGEELTSGLIPNATETEKEQHFTYEDFLKRIDGTYFGYADFTKQQLIDRLLKAEKAILNIADIGCYNGEFVTICQKILNDYFEWSRFFNKKLGV